MGSRPHERNSLTKIEISYGGRENMGFQKFRPTKSLIGPKNSRFLEFVADVELEDGLSNKNKLSISSGMSFLKNNVFQQQQKILG